MERARRVNISLLVEFDPHTNCVGSKLITNWCGGNSQTAKRPIPIGNRDLLIKGGA